MIVRYDIERVSETDGQETDCQMVVAEYGEYVLHDDYMDLERKLAQLTAQVEFLWRML